MFDETRKIVSQAGEYTRSRFGKVKPRWKDVDFRGLEAHAAKRLIVHSVTAVDFEVQSMILQRFKENGYHFDIGLLAEEQTRDVEDFAADAEYRFVVDGLDGSLNFALANPEDRRKLEREFDMRLSVNPTWYGISVGLQHVPTGQFLYACVFLPKVGENGEFFEALHGRGARKNNVRLETVRRSPDRYRLSHIIGINSKSDAIKDVFGRHSQPNCTTYGLMAVADGTYWAYVARHTALHDFGPSTLIVQEAGNVAIGKDLSRLDFRTVPPDNILPLLVCAPTPVYAKALTDRIQESHPTFLP